MLLEMGGSLADTNDSDTGDRCGCFDWEAGTITAVKNAFAV
jgi:hypothetical protein